MNACEILLHPKQLCILKNPPSSDTADSHSFFEIDCLISGHCTIRLEQHSFSLAPGSFCFIPPGKSHSLQMEKDCCLYQLLLSPDILEQLLAFSFDNNIFAQFFLQAVFSKTSGGFLICTPADSDSPSALILDSIYLENKKTDAYSNRMLFHLFLTLLYQLMRSYQNTLYDCPDTAKSAHMAVIARYLMQNYKTASLSGLADQLNYSLSYCSRFVVENTGYTFKQLQKKIRMQKAVTCLLTSDMQLSEIAEQLGYSSPENFMKVFKQEYGLTPTQYRERMKPQ